MSSEDFNDTDMASASQEIVDCGLGARSGVDPLDDDRAVEMAVAFARRQAARDDDRSGRHAPVADLTGRAVVDFRTLADEHAHSQDRILLDDHAFDDFGARADET